MNSSGTKVGFRSVIGLAFASCIAFEACHPVVLISPYDATIPSVLQGYRYSLNVLVKRAGAGAGTAAGTFDASKDAYVDLEAKIDGLVAQAKAQDQGIGCKLDDKTWNRVKAQFAKAAGLPASSPTIGDGYGCITMMLTNVQQNLTTLESIHKDPAQCVSKVPEFPTCLRPAAAQDVLNISNQTIDAVLFVEQALKKQETE